MFHSNQHQKENLAFQGCIKTKLSTKAWPDTCKDCPEQILSQNQDQDARPLYSSPNHKRPSVGSPRAVLGWDLGTPPACFLPWYLPSSTCMGRPHPVLLDPFSSRDATQGIGLVLNFSSVQAGSRYKCSCNHIIAYTVIVQHCRIKRFFHIKYSSQAQSLLYPLTHFIKFTSFLLCLCTSVPSAVCTKSYWHLNIKLLWQEDIPLAK